MDDLGTGSFTTARTAEVHEGVLHVFGVGDDTRSATAAKIRCLVSRAASARSLCWYLRVVTSDHPTFT